MTETTQRETGKDLTSEALELLIATRDLSARERDAARGAWRAQSPGHEDALTVAEAEWALLGALADGPPKGAERCRLVAEAVVARVADHPRQAAAAGLVALSAAAGLVFAPLLFDFGAERQRLARAESQLIPHPQPSIEAYRFETAWGEQKEVTLSDGSRVWLNWNTEIRVKYAEAERHVDLLRGAALFNVADDSERAFIVHAGDAVAQVTGTEFGVHKHDRQRIYFEVKKGAVVVNAVDVGAPVELRQAQTVNFVQGSLSAVRAASVESIGSWREGVLIFDDRPLAEVLDELAHYTSVHLVIGPLAAPDAPVTATFFIEDADDAVLSLAEAFDLEAGRRRDGALLVRSRSS